MHSIYTLHNTKMIRINSQGSLRKKTTYTELQTPVLRKSKSVLKTISSLKHPVLSLFPSDFFNSKKK